ncbi:MAG: hypothetical protein ACK56V_02245 [Bacteroidota bacterium]
MRNASEGSFEMKAPFNNNLSTQTNDVMVNPINPVNPDSKPMAAARVISNGDWGGGCFLGMFPVNYFESGCLGF